jgi:hypothetical protein
MVKTRASLDEVVVDHRLVRRWPNIWVVSLCMIYACIKLYRSATHWRLSALEATKNAKQSIFLWRDINSSREIKQAEKTLTPIVPRHTRLCPLSRRWLETMVARLTCSPACTYIEVCGHKYWLSPFSDTLEVDGATLVVGERWKFHGWRHHMGGDLGSDAWYVPIFFYPGLEWPVARPILLSPSESGPLRQTPTVSIPIVDAVGCGVEDKEGNTIAGSNDDPLSPLPSPFT